MLSGGRCSGFLCKTSHFCISSELKCNKQKNCGYGDDSDEPEECEIYFSSTEQMLMSMLKIHSIFPRFLSHPSAIQHALQVTGHLPFCVAAIECHSPVHLLWPSFTNWLSNIVYSWGAWYAADAVAEWLACRFLDLYGRRFTPSHIFNAIITLNYFFARI